MEGFHNETKGQRNWKDVTMRLKLREKGKDFTVRENGRMSQ